MVDGKRPPGAIVLLSDGASNDGSDPIAAAREAASQHIPIYTIALGTYKGTIPITRNGTTVTVYVPPSPQGLAQIASASGGQAFTASDTSGLRAVYEHLAAKLGHKTVKQRDHRELRRCGPGAAAGRQRPHAALVRPPHLTS